MRLQLSWPLFLLPALTALLGGCTTSAVWEEGQFARYREPAVPAHLNLFESPQTQDLLVVYDECREGEGPIRRRAYWLNQNLERIRDGRKPRFVSLKAAEGLAPVSVAEYRQVMAQTAGSSSLCAIASTNSPGFTLWAGDQELGYHQFPVYADSSGRTKQVLLTPVAVVADVTIVGAVIVYVTAPEWWEGLNYVHR